ncbi:MAG TPA: sulfatase [Agriterribacter sp.]|nr:sulfatase [Agriterribacter sp.]
MCYSFHSNGARFAIVFCFLWLCSFQHLFAQKNGQAVGGRQPYNVLFIFVDDLRPELGCYGKNYIHSPNIDALAAEGILFTHQFVTVPTCGASRSGLLTGRRPRTTDELSNDVLEIKQNSGIALPVPESFVQLFRMNGYNTVGIGKISHSADGYIYKYREPKSKRKELPQSWDEMLFDAGKWGTGWNAFFGYADGSNRNERNYEVKPYENADVPDDGYPDGLTANLAITKIKELAVQQKPFFLGVGFFKPHLPFNAPKRYWDLYEEANIPLTPSTYIPQGVNLASLHESNEFNNGYRKSDEHPTLSQPVSEAYARKLRHAYFAAVSFTDAQIGKLLSALKAAGLDKNTVVILWGDHGWHLGDDRVWGKHTLFDWSLRSPLIMKIPGGAKAVVSNHIISAIDIYPTLMDICGIKVPLNIDGKNFAALLKDPNTKNWNNVAYSYFRKGISLRTNHYRLTKYYRAEMPDVELYDHRNDPFERENIAAKYPEIVERLMPLLERGNTGLYQPAH